MKIKHITLNINKIIFLFSFIIIFFTNTELFAIDSIKNINFKKVELINRIDVNENWKEIKVLEDILYSNGYLVVLLKNININDILSDKLNLSVYFVNDLDSLNSKNLIYLYQNSEITESLAIFSFKNNNINKFNSFLYYYDLFNNFHEPNCESTFFRNIRQTISMLIDKKTIMEKNGKYYLIFRVDFVSILLEANNSEKYFLPYNKITFLEFNESDLVLNNGFNETIYSLNYIK